MNNERRYRILYAPVNTLLRILDNQVRTVDFDLPSDARVVHVSYAFERDALALIIESAEFEPVLMGAEIPPMYGHAGFKMERI